MDTYTNEGKMAEYMKKPKAYVVSCLLGCTIPVIPD